MIALRAALLAALVAPAVATAQAVGFFDKQLSAAEQAYVGAADAMPESQYAFVPSQGDYKGVRTFAQQVQHVASSNYYFFSKILNEKSTVNADAPLTSKADLMKLLRDSFVYGHKAMASITPANEGTTGGTAIAAIGHTWNLYGQTIEYLRLNSIVPPASRGK